MSSGCAGSSCRRRCPQGCARVRSYVSEGQCVTYRFEFEGTANASTMVLLDAALAFQPRTELVDEVARRSGLVLCGAGAPPCAGDPG